MAWSDAARAAALEARRMHAKMKGEFSRGKSPYSGIDSVMGARAFNRKALAADLKGFRKGKSLGGAGIDVSMHRMSVASTAYRNVVRRAGFVAKK